MLTFLTEIDSQGVSIWAMKLVSKNHRNTSIYWNSVELANVLISVTSFELIPPPRMSSNSLHEVTIFFLPFSSLRISHAVCAPIHGSSSFSHIWQLTGEKMGNPKAFFCGLSLKSTTVIMYQWNVKPTRQCVGTLDNVLPCWTRSKILALGDELQNVQRLFRSDISIWRYHSQISGFGYLWSRAYSQNCQSLHFEEVGALNPKPFELQTSPGHCNAAHRIRAQDYGYLTTDKMGEMHISS